MARGTSRTAGGWPGRPGRAGGSASMRSGSAARPARRRCRWTVPSRCPRPGTGMGRACSSGTTGASRVSPGPARVIPAGSAVTAHAWVLRTRRARAAESGRGSGTRRRRPQPHAGHRTGCPGGPGRRRPGRPAPVVVEAMKMEHVVAPPADGGHRRAAGPPWRPGRPGSGARRRSPARGVRCTVRWTAFPRRVTIYEVGPRDGLQNESALVPAEVKAEFIRRLVAAGLRAIEATSFVHPEVGAAAGRRRGV